MEWITIDLMSVAHTIDWRDAFYQEYLEGNAENMLGFLSCASLLSEKEVEMWGDAVDDILDPDSYTGYDLESDYCSEHIKRTVDSLMYFRGLGGASRTSDENVDQFIRLTPLHCAGRTVRSRVFVVVFSLIERKHVPFNTSSVDSDGNPCIHYIVQYFKNIFLDYTGESKEIIYLEYQSILKTFSDTLYFLERNTFYKSVFSVLSSDEETYEIKAVGKDFPLEYNVTSGLINVLCQIFSDEDVYLVISKLYQNGEQVLQNMILNPTAVIKVLRYTPKINLNIKGSFGFTLLHVAIHMMSLYTRLNRPCLAERVFSLFIYLIESHAVINVVDMFGRTPLYYAIRLNNSPEVIETLLKRGARTFGYTPLADVSHGLTPEFERFLEDFIQKEQVKEDCLYLENDFSNWLGDFITYDEFKEYNGVMLENKETKRIFKTVYSYVKELKNYIASENSFWDFSIELGGSTAEGTKVGDMDELDFVLVFKDSRLYELIKNCFERKSSEMMDIMEACSGPTLDEIETATSVSETYANFQDPMGEFYNETHVDTEAESLEGATYDNGKSSCSSWWESSPQDKNANSINIVNYGNDKAGDSAFENVTEYFKHTFSVEESNLSSIHFVFGQVLNKAIENVTCPGKIGKLSIAGPAWNTQLTITLPNSRTLTVSIDFVPALKVRDSHHGLIHGKGHTLDANLTRRHQCKYLLIKLGKLVESYSLLERRILSQSCGEAIFGYAMTKYLRNILEKCSLFEQTYTKEEQKKLEMNIGVGLVPSYQYKRDLIYSDGLFKRWKPRNRFLHRCRARLCKKQPNEVNFINESLIWCEQIMKSSSKLKNKSETRDITFHMLCAEEYSDIASYVIGLTKSNLSLV